MINISQQYTIAVGNSTMIACNQSMDELHYKDRYLIKIVVFLQLQVNSGRNGRLAFEFH